MYINDATSLSITGEYFVNPEKQADIRERFTNLPKPASSAPSDKTPPHPRLEKMVAS